MSDKDAVGRKEEKSHHPSNILMRESATSSNSDMAKLTLHSLQPLILKGNIEL